MAARKENILSLEHLTGPKRNTFTKRKEHRLKMSRGMHLQQRWHELKERELTAQQNNRQLLQQFEEAQDTLKEMLTLTAAMKTIRMEYERYLEESCPRWQQQLKEKTQAAQRKRMAYLRSCLKNTEERETASSADQPLPAQGSTIMNHNIAAPPMHYSPNSHLDYNQDGSPHLSYVQSSWQTRPQSQTARFPIGALYQPQASSHVPPSFLPPHIFTHPHSLQLHHLTSSPGDRHHRPRQNPPGWASLQPDYPWSWVSGAAGIPSGSEALWGQFHTEELLPDVGRAQGVRQETDTSSKRERGGGSSSSRLSQELDIKPVRLSGGISESSESTRTPSQVSRENRKSEEGGRSQCSSSDSKSCISQDLSRSSSAIVIAAVKVVQGSESDASSEKGRTSTRRGKRRSGGLSVGSPRDENGVKGSKGDEPGSHNEESQSTSEELESLIVESRSEKADDQNPDDKSEGCGEESGSQKEEESGSVSIKIENGGGDEIEKQESSSSEQSIVGEKDEEDQDGEEDENSQTDEEQEERDGEEDHEASERNDGTEEDEETAAEDEEQDSEDEEVDEDESDGGEDNMEDKESDEEDQRGDLAGEPEEERDSDDSIISPQEKSKKMYIITEEASEEDEEEREEEEEGSKTGSSDDDSNEISDEDDVENLLAPQELSEKKEEKDLTADEQPKEICDKVEIFQVEPDKSTKSDHPSDSDEFDNFYG